jgi:hypothetical protein
VTALDFTPRDGKFTDTERDQIGVKRLAELVAVGVVVKSLA